MHIRVLYAPRDVGAHRLARLMKDRASEVPAHFQEINYKFTATIKVFCDLKPQTLCP
jgi:hypothetical protein